MTVQSLSPGACDQFPFPWSIEDELVHPPHLDGTEKFSSPLVDPNTSLLDRWLSEFGDEECSGSCPPPMS